MAEQSITSSLQTIDFRKDFMREYVRKNRFSDYTGRGVDNIICQKLGSGHTLRHPLVTRLQGAGVSGSTMLRGTGESIGNYSWDTVPTYYRHAVEFNKEDYEKTNLALMAEARPLLLEWAMNETRDRQIEAMGAVYGSSNYSNLMVAGTGSFDTYADAWMAANTDRIIFGNTEYAVSSGDFSAGLLTIDATASQCVYQRVDDMRRLAEDADPHIRPFKTDQESEVFVLFLGSHSFNAAKTSLLATNYTGDVRGMNLTRNGNIIARDGDLYYNGVIIRKVPEITTIFSSSSGALYNTGAGLAVNVEAAFMCGQQSLVHGMGQAPDVIVDREYDFKFRPAVAVELKEDIKKTFFNGVQHGMVSGFFAGEPV